MFKKIKNYIMNKPVMGLTFVTGLIIIGIIYKLQEVAPFGRNSMLTIDFFHQYGPMLGELFDRIKSGSNLIYSFTMGMGLPFIRNFMNYLSSPFNILILFFKHENIIMSYSLIIGLKAICAAVTMNYYLTKKFNTQSTKLIPLGILYGFCAYFTAYYWNIMWLDCLVLLPLIIYGIERLIDDDKPLFYIVSLAIMIIANYFIAFMICFFAVLYFIAYLVLKTEHFDKKVIIKKCLLFAFASLIAGGLTAILLLPLFLGLSSISATSDSWPSSQYYAFTFWEYLANHFTGVGSTVLSSGVSNAANISCGILSIALLFLFIINPSIKLKTKFVYFSLILFMIASFFYAKLDFIWHAFHVPNDLPYRYSFIYSFVLIIIAAYSIIHIKKIKFINVTAVYIFTLILISLLYFFNYKNITNQMIFFNALLITVYYIIYALYYYYKISHKFLPLIFILAIILEVTVSVNRNWDILQYIDEFYDDYDSTKAALNYVKEKDSDMYRIERTWILTYNDPSWYNYYGQTTFSSMAYQSLAVLQNYLGLPGNNINSYYYKQTTPIYDLMFNIKYFIGDSKDIKRYTLFYNEDDNNYIFKSNYNAGLMFAVNNNVKNWEYLNTNPFAIQNDFVYKTTGVEDVFRKLDYQKIDVVLETDFNTIIKYTFNNLDDNIYFFSNEYDIDFIVADGTLYYLNQNYDYYIDADEEIDIFNYEDFNERHIINTRSEDGTYEIYVGYNYYNEEALYSYTINNDKFEEAALRMQEGQVTINEFKEHYIKAHINLEEEKTIYTSIPYDKGWKVEIDGKSVTTNKIGNALLSFDVQPGEHDIVLTYVPNGFKVGAGISVLSLVTIIGSIIYKKKFLKQKI